MSDVTGTLFDEYDAEDQDRVVDDMNCYVHPDNYELYYNLSAGTQARLDGQYDLYDAGDQDRDEDEYDTYSYRTGIADDF